MSDDWLVTLSASWNAEGMAFSDEITEQLNELFPTEVERAGQILQPRQSDRLLRAVLKLSKGDLTRLQHFSDAASRDERDVLLWAETPRREGEPITYEELTLHLGLPPDK